MGVDPQTISVVLSGALTVLWYLLRQKDAAQGEQIKLLFSKHDEDVKELQALKLAIAQEHYVKGELDAKFDKLESTFRDGFNLLGGKFDRLSDALLAHISQERERVDK